MDEVDEGPAQDPRRREVLVLQQELYQDVGADELQARQPRLVGHMPVVVVVHTVGLSSIRKMFRLDYLLSSSSQL
jgi:hypothetical protein